MRDARRVTHTACGQTHVRRQNGDDAAIAELAARQHGVVARQQLLALGLSGRCLDHRLAVGRLHRVFPGTYAVGHPAAHFRARSMAAVLSATPEAAASHLNSATLWGVHQTIPTRLEVTASQPRAARPGVLLYRARLPAEELTCVEGIPVTSVARTLLDLSGTLDARALRRLVKEAELLGLTDGERLARILAAHPRRRGRRALAAIVEGWALDAGRTRSELEDRFLRLCARQRLPMPETNVMLEVRGRRIEVDCLWRRERVVVELDGFTAHGRRSAFAEDRARDRALTAAGYAPMRVTWTQVTREADTLAREIRDTLMTRFGDRRRITHTAGG